MRRHLTLLSGAVFCLSTLSYPVFAEDKTDADVIYLDKIIITTPLRRDSSLERATSTVTVIDEKDIEHSAANDLPSLLKSYGGVFVTSNGGMGSTSGISLRGLSDKQTLVLVDGVRVSSATSGTPNLSAVPLAAIERIEIAMGAHSAKYGADASGGIINIITKQGDSCANGKSYCGTYTVGVSHPWGGFASSFLSGKTKDDVKFALGLNLIGTQGYDFKIKSLDPGRNGFLEGSANIALSKDYEWGKLYMDALYSRARNEYDRTSIDAANKADTNNASGKLGLRLDHSEDWSTTIELLGSLDYSDHFRGSKKYSRFDTNRYGAFLNTQKTFETELATHIFSAGAESYQEKISSNETYDKNKRNLSALFAQYSADIAAFTLDSGIRYDYNQQFGSATTYNLGASYELLAGLTLRSSFGTGFRAPTFNDLYYPTGGNPDLQPEHTRTYEIGANWQITNQTILDVAIYQNNVKDLISWAPESPGSSIYKPYNNEKARIRGVTASLSHDFNENWHARAIIDFLNPINKSSDNYGKYLRDRERKKFTAELSWQATEALLLTTRMLYGGSRYTNAGNTKQLPSFVTADFVANYQWDEQSAIKLSVENMFDKQYQTKDGYRAPGRTINFGITRSF